MKKVTQFETDKEMLRRLYLNKNPPKVERMPLNKTFPVILFVLGMLFLIALPKIDKRFDFPIHRSPLNKTK